MNTFQRQQTRRDSRDHALHPFSFTGGDATDRIQRSAARARACVRACGATASRRANHSCRLAKAAVRSHIGCKAPSRDTRDTRETRRRQLDTRLLHCRQSVLPPAPPLFIALSYRRRSRNQNQKKSIRVSFSSCKFPEESCCLQIRAVSTAHGGDGGANAGRTARLRSGSTDGGGGG